MTQNKRQFAVADADMKPTLVCTGYIFRVLEGHESKSGNYNVNPVEIQPYGGGRPITFQFLSRPDWLAIGNDGKPSFRPASLKKAEGGKSMLFVYKKMINSQDKVSALAGLAGTEERLTALEEAMVSAEGLDGDDSPAVLEGIFNDILVAKDGEDAVEIGYVLKQARSKTDDVDEEGKAIYIAENRYDLSEFWLVSDANKKKYRKIAEKSADRQKAKGEPVSFKVTFDEGVSAPF